MDDFYTCYGTFSALSWTWENWIQTFKGSSAYLLAYIAPILNLNLKP